MVPFFCLFINYESNFPCHTHKIKYLAYTILKYSIIYGMPFLFHLLPNALLQICSNCNMTGQIRSHPLKCLVVISDLLLFFSRWSQLTSILHTCQQFYYMAFFSRNNILHLYRMKCYKWGFTFDFNIKAED